MTSLRERKLNAFFGSQRRSFAPSRKGKPELDFSQNRADHDDVLGDAYEYLIRHFASESGKSKGQFYTPAEVSRVIARVIEHLKKGCGASSA